MSSKDRYALAQEALDIVSTLLVAVMPDLAKGGEPTRQALTCYAVQVERLSQLAEQADLTAVQAVSMFVLSGVRQLSELGRALTEAEQNLLEMWPTLAVSYLEDPGNMDVISALLDFLQQPDWINPLPIEEAESLLTLLVPEIEAPTSTAADMTAAIADEEDSVVPLDQYPALAEQALDIVGGLLEIMPELAMGGATTQQALTRYAHQVEALAQRAEEVHLTGIQAVSMIVHEGVQQLAILERGLTQEELDLLEQWPVLLMSYLDNPADLDGVGGLLEFLQQPAWVRPLPSDEAEMLLVLLQTETTQHDLLPPAPPVMPRVEAPVAESHPTGYAAEAPPAVEELLLVLPLVEVPAQMEANEEMVAMLRVEADTLLPVWDELLEQAADPAAHFDGALETYAEQLERMASAAEVVSLIGLQHFFVYLHALVSGLRMFERALTAPEKALLQQWPVHFAEYLTDLTQLETAQALVAVLQDTAWFAPLEQEIATQLAHNLTAVTLTQVLIDEDAVPRQTLASAADVSLTLPDDVSPELLEGLLIELPHQTAEFSTAIQRLVAGEGGQAEVDVAKRIAHTLKGAANTVGIPAIAHLTHQVEDILLAFTKHGALPSGNLANALVNAADMLAGMSESLLGVGEPPELAERLACLQEILDWANQIDKEGIPQADQTVTPQRSVPPTEEVPAHSAEAAAAVEQTVPTLRVDVPIIDNLLRLSGESIILTGQLQEKLAHIREQSRLAQQHNKVLLQLSADLEYLVDVQDVFNIQRNRQDSGFDSLEFDHYNEVHTYIRRLIESAIDSQSLTQGADAELLDLESMLADQQRLNRENQDSVLRTRMIPVHSISPRLQRGVRQTCRLLDKTVNFTIEGEHTFVDSDMLSALVEPLMHILRNAIDHGIEAPEHRQLLNKPEVGNIVLSFALEGDHITIRCQDDGRGIDPVVIRYKAIEMGLVTADDERSESEWQRLIFMPGFSTKSTASQTSGRGIGMDVVATKIQSLKGSVEIASVVDEGTSLSIFLPLTLVSAHALLVRSHRQIFALVNRGIEQILYHGSGILKRQGEQFVFTLEGQNYEAKPLEWLTNVPIDERRSLERQERPLLLVRSEGVNRVVMVEAVLESRDIVVKPLGTYLPAIRGIMGATILGDGSIAPVLDLPELLRVSREVRATQPLAQPKAVERNIPCALVVDDSLSARRALEQLVQDMGLECRAARDGLEAVEVIRSKRPDIILVDMEMPRMNGLELTAHVRAQECTQDIPIIMITSRSTEKHRQLAHSAGVNLYLTKPFSEDELMSHIQATLKLGG